MTSSLTGAILIGSLLLVAAGWIIVEIIALRDKIPDNHITAVVRAAVAKQPGVFIAFAWLMGFLCGHLFWP